MNFDPQKFFIGLMDFFSILLPGGLLTYLLMGKVGPVVLGDGYSQLAGAEAWAVFLFANYLLGHLVFLLSYWLDGIYDWLRDWTLKCQIRHLASTGRVLSWPSRACVSLVFNREPNFAVNRAVKIKESALAPLEVAEQYRMLIRNQFENTVNFSLRKRSSILKNLSLQSALTLSDRGNLPTEGKWCSEFPSTRQRLSDVLKPGGNARRQIEPSASVTGRNAHSVAVRSADGSGDAGTVSELTPTHAPKFIALTETRSQRTRKLLLKEGQLIEMIGNNCGNFAPAADKGGESSKGKSWDRQSIMYSGRTARGKRCVCSLSPSLRVAAAFWHQAS